jgi:hypothetical protein
VQLQRKYDGTACTIKKLRKKKEMWEQYVDIRAKGGLTQLTRLRRLFASSF